MTGPYEDALASRDAAQEDYDAVIVEAPTSAAFLAALAAWADGGTDDVTVAGGISYPRATVEDRQFQNLVLRGDADLRIRRDQAYAGILGPLQRTLDVVTADLAGIRARGATQADRCAYTAARVASSPDPSAVGGAHSKEGWQNALRTELARYDEQRTAEAAVTDSTTLTDLHPTYDEAFT